MKKISYKIFVLVIVTMGFLQNVQAKSDYLDSNLSSEERVSLLLKEMKLDEKIGQMCQYVGEASEGSIETQDTKLDYTLGLGERAGLIRDGKVGSFLKVASYREANILQELAAESRLKIPLLIATDALHGHGMYSDPATLYATEIGLASSFDTGLAEAVARSTAIEMRATGYHWAFSPNIEVVRDPRWGRFGETFGEDPYLVTQMGNAMVRGYQGENFNGQENVIASAKHFVGGGIAYNGVNGASADISERTLQEIFFPPFLGAIESGVYTIMPAHNDINGIPSHAHARYLTDLIRKQWGFKGFYISDWKDIARLQSVHKVVETEEAASQLAVLAGMDMNMHGPGFFDHIKSAVLAEKIPLHRIDDAVSKILYAKFQLGLFENRYVDKVQLEKTVLRKEHLDLALESARKSLVLLKNNNTFLPLATNVSRILVTGPGANNQTILGEWSRLQPEDNVVTVLEGIESVASNKTKVDFLPIDGYGEIDDSIIKKAAKMAAKSDVAVVVVGENSLRFDKDKTSGENLDRPSLELVGDQLALLKIIKSQGVPLVVVLINGGPIASEWLVENADAIIEAWEPGMFGGQAIAEAIFGLYNPGGRLPITVPRSVGHLQSYYNHKPSAFHRGGFYQSSRSPLFEFGFGLSYTQFQYSDLQMRKTVDPEADMELSVILKNTGVVAGDEVVLVYLNDKVSSVTTPVRKLVAFDRVHLKAGEKRKMKLNISKDHFKLLDVDMKIVLEPGEFEVVIGDDRLIETIIAH